MIPAILTTAAADSWNYYSLRLEGEDVTIDGEERYFRHNISDRSIGMIREDRMYLHSVTMLHAHHYTFVTVHITNISTQIIDYHRN